MHTPAQNHSYMYRNNFAWGTQDFPIYNGIVLRGVRNIVPTHIGIVLHGVRNIFPIYIGIALHGVRKL